MRSVCVLVQWALLTCFYVRCNVVVAGKYTFLSLFLAVMLEAFEAKYDVQAGGACGCRMIRLTPPANSASPSSSHAGCGGYSGC